MKQKNETSGIRKKTALAAFVRDPDTDRRYSDREHRQDDGPYEHRQHAGLVLEYSDRCIVVLEGEIIADDNPVTILNQKDLLESANLKQTSLYSLGQKLLCDPVKVTQYYIEKGGPYV